PMMNGTVATTPIEITGAAMRKPFAVREYLTSARKAVEQTTLRQRVAAGSIATVLVGAGLWLTMGTHFAAYFTVFALSALSNATLFLPSGSGLIMVSGAVILNPLMVALLGAIGGGLGNLTGYFIGKSSRNVIKKDYMPRWVINKAQKNTNATIFVVSLIPNPFVDAHGILAGRLGVPLKQYLVYSIIGKIIQSVVLVYLALWNISLVKSFLG
ncbi:MAG: VTT domain-containing protein, partial [SAR202 cluster bacterium]|nr:VTT domain-containing protein [SAR202 cluster bacterium]